MCIRDRKEWEDKNNKRLAKLKEKEVRALPCPVSFYALGVPGPGLKGLCCCQDAAAAAATAAEAGAAGATAA
eukprot:2094290-Rhodomonas_salina.1